jgi:hypothetical protein
VIVDLVSPWAATFDAPDPAQARERFRSRHADVLDALRRHRAPHADAYPIPGEARALHLLAARASNLDLQQLLRDQLHAAVALGTVEPTAVLLLAGGDEGGAVETLPGPRSTVTLFFDRAPDTTDLIVALSRGLAELTRWSAPDSQSAVRALRHDPWDRWQLGREIPLGEWLYAEGLGVHLAQALLPDVPTHRLLGSSRGALRRIREREHALRAQLESDINQAGLGLVLRWLAPAAPLSVRTAGGAVLPQGAGRYLAWRMTAERVARVGIAEALRMSVDR